MSRAPRRSGDDFFCWKYQLWYSMKDCVFRHGWRTTEICATCEQGAANMKIRGRPAPPPRWARLPTLPLPEDDRERS